MIIPQKETRLRSIKRKLAELILNKYDNTPWSERDTVVAVPALILNKYDNTLATCFLSSHCAISVNP